MRPLQGGVSYNGGGRGLRENHYVHPSADGLVYERRVTEAGEFVTPASEVKLLDKIIPGFVSAFHAFRIPSFHRRWICSAI